MKNDITNIYLFTNAFEKYLNNIKKSDFWIYSRKTFSGSLLINNLGNNKKIIIKPWDSSNPIGAIRTEKFITKTETFKGKILNNYIFVTNIFKENAIRKAKVDKKITLITVNLQKKEITIYGSMNIDLNLLNHFVEFSDFINFTISYDFEGLLKHEGFKSDKKNQLVIVQSRTKNPKVFFSYSWDNEQHKRWVLKLAADLIKAGIDVLIDEWDLDKFNNDLHQFMELGIFESDKVIMICTPKYSIKANRRIGGVGIENTIITGEFYNKESANKYLPIVKDYKKHLHDCLPIYLKTKYSIDFNKESEYNVKFDELIRKILNVPRYKKPELGKLQPLESKEI
jgi:hypothetical protein